MAKKEIHELSYDELMLYEDQLIQELSRVKFRIRQLKRTKLHTASLKQHSSQESGKKQ